MEHNCFPREAKRWSPAAGSGRQGSVRSLSFSQALFHEVMAQKDHGSDSYGLPALRQWLFRGLKSDAAVSSLVAFSQLRARALQNSLRI